jgi:antitoxin MazE
MRIFGWGNSLAVRLPANVIDTLDLKEGDAVDVRAVGERSIEISVRSRRPEGVRTQATHRR